jgi:uncharacterized membrane protein (DUF2068 family)
MPQQNGRILRLIAVAKLVKAAILAATGLGALSMLSTGVAHTLHGWVLHLAPGNATLRGGFAHARALPPHTLELAGIGFLAYAVLFTIEGVGLWIQAVWAEYLTIGITSSFVPFEIYELVKSVSIAKSVALAANIAIVIYLVLKLRKDGKWPFNGGDSSSSFAA